MFAFLGIVSCRRMKTTDTVYSIRDIYCGFSNREVLQGLSLDIKEKELVCIAGENGAGKTTLLKCMLGLLPVKRGSIMLKGVRVESKKHKASSHKAAYISQMDASSDFAVSGYEVVEIGTIPFNHTHSERESCILKAMEHTGSCHLRHRNYSELSGGERQRIQAARCLVQRPSVMLLDEPASRLDPAAKKSLIELFESLECAVVLVTHDEKLYTRPGWRLLRLANGGLS